MVPMTTEQQTALDILRTSSSIATAEQLAALINNPNVPKFCQLSEGTRRRWLGQQINGLNYMAHSPKITSEIDLTIEASMLDQAIMGDGNIKWLTQVEMQDAFRRGVTREYGDYFGITAASLTGFLRSFMSGEKRKRAKDIILEEERKKRKEGDKRFFTEIERLKAEGKFTPTWGPQYNFKKDKDDNERNQRGD